jgi:hypothetical protein
MGIGDWAQSPIPNPQKEKKENKQSYIRQSIIKIKCFINLISFKMNTNLLNNSAFDIVKDKVIEDKVKEYTEDQQREAEEKYKQAKKDEENAEEFPDIEESDSEEERIMQKELMKRKEHFDKITEKENKKKTMKYGTYKDIIETEFLDTMLKNENVVCHFYHNDFERCKIMDKHLKIVAETHPDTLFVRINAEKTPFFTTKLQVKVI